MFNTAYVHVKKNEKHWDQFKDDTVYIVSSQRENISIWEKFKNLDDLINSPLWLESCDLDIPLNAVGGDYCPLCTRNTNHEVISKIFDWGSCKDCVVVHCDEEYNSDYKGRDYTIISEVNNRPVIFSYWNRPYYQTNVFIDKVESYLNLINNKIGIHSRVYKKKYIDESPETLEKQRKAWEEIWKKEQQKKQEEEQELNEWKQDNSLSKIPINQYFARDKNGLMVEVPCDAIDDYDPYAKWNK